MDKLTAKKAHNGGGDKTTIIKETLKPLNGRQGLENVIVKTVIANTEMFINYNLVTLTSKELIIITHVDFIYN